MLLQAETLRPCLSSVNCPAQDKGHRCSFLSHAGHLLRPQFIATIFQLTALRLSVDDLAHSSRSWVTGQAQGVSAYLSAGSSRLRVSGTAFSSLESTPGS